MKNQHSKLPPANRMLPDSCNAPINLRQESRWRFNPIKWGLGCAGLAMLMSTGIATIVLIITPLIFRSLLPEQQASVTYRFPFMAAFKPTRSYGLDVLPTAASNDADAMALLKTPVASPTVINGSDNKPSAVSDNSNGAANSTKSPAQTPAFVSGTVTTTELLPPATVDAPPDASNVSLSRVNVLPAAYHATGFTLEKQKWNNCGPANLVQALRFYGWQGTQTDAASFLKPNREDKNVSPWQMVSYVNTKTQLRALTRTGGDLNLIKQLVLQRFAVILEKGYNVAGEGWMGHYLTIVGYDDRQGLLHGLDTYLGEGSDNLGITEKYEAIDSLWQQFNRLYIVIYPADREQEVAAILGPQADLTYNATYTLNKARAEASSEPANPFAWFNLGGSYASLGQYREATIAFDRARNAGAQLPWRMLWYQFTPYEAYYNVGNYTEVLALTQTTLATTPFVEETYYWQGMALAAQGNTTKATEAFKQTLKLNSNYWPAADRLKELQDGSFRGPGSTQQSK